MAYVVELIDEDKDGNEIDDQVLEQEGHCSEVSFMSVIRVSKRDANLVYQQSSGGNNDSDEALSSDFSYLEQAGIYVVPLKNRSSQ